MKEQQPICPKCESDNVSVHGDKVQYIICHDCGYSQSAEHEEIDEDFDDEMDADVLTKPKKEKTKKKPTSKKSTKSKGKKK